jgi:N-acetylmuramoyl-L-alanine amidase
MSRINIVLSPSQQWWNKCVEGDSEQDHTFLIAQRCADYLRSYECNVLLIPKLKGTEEYTLSEVVKISNDFVNTMKGTSFHLDIHSDGGYTARGASGFYLSEVGQGFISRIHQELVKLTPWGDGGVSRRDLYVLQYTKAVAGLLEISFHDNPTEAKWIHMNIDAIAQAIVKGLENATGIKRLSPAQHWAEPAYKKLLEKGYVINDKRFDDKLTRGELFAILSQK